MKRQIRKGVFETNSSSTHAICITRKDVGTSNLPNHITFTHGEFGGEFDVHEDTWNKASYLYQAICDLCYGDDNQKKKMLNTLETLLKEYGIECEFEPDKDEEYGDGYIDHGSETEEFVNAVLADCDKLIKFLFGDSFIVTGNDNSDEYSDYMYTQIGEEKTEWGSFPRYGDLKPEFEEYEIYKKGN